MLAMTTATHAATPMTLHFGDMVFGTGAAIELPMPPAPKVTRPDVARMRLIIKAPPRGCNERVIRRPVGERRRVEAQPALTPFPLG